MTSATYLGRTEGWLTYDFLRSWRASWREAGRGRGKAWFAFRFDGAESEIDLEAHPQPEFDDWRWGYLAERPT